jgi:hypothetical protein
MKLPRFWRDTGSWNDPVVSTGIVLGLATWGGLGWWLELPWLLAAAVLLGPASGGLLGLGLVAVLCRFFAKEKAEQGQWPE